MDMTGTGAGRQSWALVIATYDRAEILEHCIRLAVEQSRPPAEVIVIDAGANWRETGESIRREVLARHSGIAFAYEPAAEKSLTVQRNQGVGLTRSDVLFLIDDDSLMHPGSAAEIMAIYEADTAGDIVGVQANLADDLPPGIAIQGERKAVGASKLGPRGGPSALLALGDWLRRKVFLMDAGELFIPYDGAAHEASLRVHMPEGAERTHLFHGCRMTFRREAVVREPFDPILRSYCPGEDLDASYRISRHGALVTARRAMLHHYQSAAGRTNRYQVTLLSALNQAVCIRRHSADPGARRAEFGNLMRRRLLAEFLKDLLSRRWNLPQMRGLLAARRWTGAIFAMSDGELESWYPDMQRRILSRQP